MRISDWSSDVCSSDLPIEALDSTLQRQQAQHRRGAGKEAGDAGGGLVIVGEGKGGGMAHPAAQIGDEPFLQMLGDIEEGWRAGSAVQIFIAAADRQLGSRPIAVDRHGAYAVAEVPEGRTEGRRGGK